MSIPFTGTRSAGKVSVWEVSPAASLKLVVPEACSGTAQQLSVVGKSEEQGGECSKKMPHGCPCGSVKQWEDQEGG